MPSKKFAHNILGFSRKKETMPIKKICYEITSSCNYPNYNTIVDVHYVTTRKWIDEWGNEASEATSMQ